MNIKLLKNILLILYLKGSNSSKSIVAFTPFLSDGLKVSSFRRTAGDFLLYLLRLRVFFSFDNLFNLPESGDSSLVKGIPKQQSNVIILYKVEVQK